MCKICRPSCYEIHVFNNQYQVLSTIAIGLINIKSFHMYGYYTGLLGSLYMSLSSSTDKIDNDRIKREMSSRNKNLLTNHMIGINLLMIPIRLLALISNYL